MRSVPFVINILLFSAVSALAQESVTMAVTKVAQAAQVPEIFVSGHLQAPPSAAHRGFFAPAPVKGRSIGGWVLLR